MVIVIKPEPNASLIASKVKPSSWGMNSVLFAPPDTMIKEWTFLFLFLAVHLFVKAFQNTFHSLMAADLQMRDICNWNSPLHYKSFLSNKHQAKCVNTGLAHVSDVQHANLSPSAESNLGEREPSFLSDPQSAVEWNGLFCISILHHVHRRTLTRNVFSLRAQITQIICWHANSLSCVSSPFPSQAISCL